MPDVTISWKIRIVNESFSGCSGQLSTGIESERIIGEFLIVEDVIFAGGGGIGSAWVNKHGGVHVVSDSLFEEFESLLELSC